MTDSARALPRPAAPAPQDSPPIALRLAPDAAQLLIMAHRLGPRDLTVLAHIIRRAAEIYETEGEEIALAVLDQVEAILRNRRADA